MSAILDIADAVTAELDAAGLNPPATVRRQIRPVFDLAEANQLQVVVVPRSQSFQQGSRGACYVDVAVDIGVQQKVDPEDAGRIGVLLGLVEQIADFLRKRRLAAVPDAVLVSAQNEPIYAPEHLDQLRQFTSVLTVTYRVMRGS